MNDVIYYTASTLNGYLADENNSLEWLFAVDQGADPSGAPGYPEFFAGVGVLVEGSTTYEWILEHDGVLEHPDKWHKFYGDRPTFVFTSRELPVPDGADVRFVSGSVAEHLSEIRAAAGEGTVWVVGGGELAGQFLDVDALDTVIVSIAPVTLDAGAPLLPRRVEADRLELRSVETFGQFAHLTYDIRRSDSQT